ncbi:MAG: GNAT family N-acetyltransferase [Burkholderiaceae bacterium]
MDIVWETRQPAQWEQLHFEQAGALQQHLAFGTAMQALGTECVRARVEQDGAVIGIAQFVVRRIAGVVGLALCSRGPIWRDGISDEQRRLACKLMAGSLPQRRPRFVFYAPDTPPGMAPEAAGIPGFTRVITGVTTVLIDLSQNDEEIRAGLHPKWRNRLVAAENSPLKFNRVGEKLAQYRWVLDREGVQRQQRSYRALPAEFVPAYQAAVGAGKPSVLTVRADLGKDAVAAMLFVIHGAAATYHLGWSDARGREHSAHNLCLWRALPLLRELQVRQLDLGGVNTQRGASLARFKLGAGGSVLLNPGTFL